jgi:hypothetical protein
MDSIRVRSNLKSRDVISSSCEFSFQLETEGSSKGQGLIRLDPKTRGDETLEFISRRGKVIPNPRKVPPLLPLKNPRRKRDCLKPLKTLSLTP